MKIFKIIITIIALLVISFGGLFIHQFDFSNDVDLDIFLIKKLKSLQGKGMAVAFIKSGEISWSKNYGYADVEAGKKITDETIFHIASVSKTVTGTAVMQLYEQGLIDLDASINNYLPFEIKNPNYPDNKISVRMLLQHKSGLIDDDPKLRSLFTIEYGLPDSDISLEEFARGYFLKDGEWFDAVHNFSNSRPGENYSYSNVGFGLLGLIVEHVSGVPFNIYCEDNIFTPLEMNSAGWLSTDVELNDMAVQYHDEIRLKPYSYPTYPDGALKISLKDYAKFLNAMMHDGTYKEIQILQQSSVKEMLADDPSNNFVWQNDVLKEFMIDTKDHHIQGHSGGDPGSFSLVMFNPENNNAVILFINGTPTLTSFRVLNIIPLIKRLAAEAELY